MRKPTSAMAASATTSQMTGKPSVPVCDGVDATTLGVTDGVAGATVAGATVGDAVADGAGVTVKSVSRFAVVCEFAIVPSRQTCEPIVAPGAITWLKGPGLLVLEPGRIPPEDVA